MIRPRQLGPSNRAWRAAHLEASLDEIEEQVSPRRRALLGMLAQQVGGASWRGRAVDGVARS